MRKARRTRARLHTHRILPPHNAAYLRNRARARRARATRRLAGKAPALARRRMHNPRPAHCTALRPVSALRDLPALDVRCRHDRRAHRHIRRATEAATHKQERTSWHATHRRTVFGATGPTTLGKTTGLRATLTERALGIQRAATAAAAVGRAGRRHPRALEFADPIRALQIVTVFVETTRATRCRARRLEAKRLRRQAVRVALAAAAVACAVELEPRRAHPALAADLTVGAEALLASIGEAARVGAAELATIGIVRSATAVALAVVEQGFVAGEQASERIAGVVAAVRASVLLTAWLGAAVADAVGIDRATAAVTTVERVERAVVAAVAVGLNRRARLVVTDVAIRGLAAGFDAPLPTIAIRIGHAAAAVAMRSVTPALVRAVKSIGPHGDGRAGPGVDHVGHIELVEPKVWVSGIRSSIDRIAATLAAPAAVPCSATGTRTGPWRWPILVCAAAPR